MTVEKPVDIVSSTCMEPASRWLNASICNRFLPLLTLNNPVILRTKNLNCQFSLVMWRVLLNNVFSCFLLIFFVSNMRIPWRKFLKTYANKFKYTLHLFRCNILFFPTKKRANAFPARQSFLSLSARWDTRGNQCSQLFNRLITMDITVKVKTLWTLQFDFACQLCSHQSDGNCKRAVKLTLSISHETTLRSRRFPKTL